MEDISIIDTDGRNIRELGVCGYKSMKRPGFPEKVGWLEERFSEGLKIKTLYSQKGGTQGMIEYIPGESCWRPVDARGYLFIHCLFVGFRKEYQGQGYAGLLLDECLRDASAQKKAGVAVVVRKGSFMAGRNIFIKKGFVSVGEAPPDFELLVLKMDAKAPDPRFPEDWRGRAERYGPGLVIIRAFQCPYTVKNVSEITATARDKFGLTPRIIDLASAAEAQAVPNPFGVFSILYDGVVIAHHPISNGRFRNIIKGLRS